MDVENATRDSNDTHYDKRIIYSCLPGYQFPDKQKQKVVHCTENETWTDFPPPCEGFNPSIATLKPQSNRPSYSNTVIGTLAVDGWAVTFGTARRGLGGLRLRPVPSSLYQM